MSPEIAAQGAAFFQAVGLGLCAGLVYDLFRILRVRVKLPLLGPLLDLLFWCGGMARPSCSAAGSSTSGWPAPGF